jgi:hypothetical protein
LCVTKRLRGMGTRRGDAHREPRGLVVARHGVARIAMLLTPRAAIPCATLCESCVLRGTLFFVDPQFCIFAISGRSDALRSQLRLPPETLKPVQVNSKP